MRRSPSRGRRTRGRTKPCRNSRPRPSPKNRQTTARRAATSSGFPATLGWTPTGWVFASGFWDLAIGARGLLFAPVYFGRAVLDGYVFRPAVALAFAAVADALFVRASFGPYYFGNYYGRSYVGLGFQPWV